MEKFIDEMQHLTKTIKIQSQKDKKKEKEEKTTSCPPSLPINLMRKRRNKPWNLGKNRKRRIRLRMMTIISRKSTSRFKHTTI